MKFCKICGRQFVPSKYRPFQGACNDIVCQRERQRQNIKDWRLKNPDYFKYAAGTDPTYRDMIRQKHREWRKSHPSRLQEYRLRYKEKTREYMREYMKKYRLKKKNIALPDSEITKKETI